LAERNVFISGMEIIIGEAFVDQHKKDYSSKKDHH
jgi:hypothetical protein